MSSTHQLDLEASRISKRSWC